MTLDISIISKETQKAVPAGPEDRQGENAGNECGQCSTTMFSSGRQDCPETWDRTTSRLSHQHS